MRRKFPSRQPRRVPNLAVLGSKLTGGETTERTETRGETTETTQITLGYFELAGITVAPVFKGHGTQEIQTQTKRRADSRRSIRKRFDRAYQFVSQNHRRIDCRLRQERCGRHKALVRTACRSGFARQHPRTHFHLFTRKNARV